MNMAWAAAKFIEENLRFPGGEKVECVIADTTIGGVADAAFCADKFEKRSCRLQGLRDLRTNIFEILIPETNRTMIKF